MQIKTDALRKVEHRCEFCVVGGGLAGMFAAIAAAREGVKVVLIQDRPVLGGNCSSEIRMWIRGAHGDENRETGLLSEVEQENIYRNPGLSHSIWDSVLWGKVMAEKNIELLLNCSCCDADTDGNGKITSVRAWQLTTYTWHEVYADYFADCSGDSILAPIVGAEYRVGREGYGEYHESMCSETGDKKTMGMSCLLQARETDHPVTYIPPEWAYRFPEDSDFGGKPSRKKKPELDADDIGNKLDTGSSVASVKIKTVTSMSRTHKPGTNETNYWWIELGGEQDSIHDSEEIRDELVKIAYGIWDHVKNHGDHGAENWELEWVGFLPGKRESRRYVGRHVLNENEVEAGGKFDDIIAFGGWPMDNHNPAGFYSFRSEQPPSKLYPAPSPYGIPYRVLYSANIKNLFFAGRNISATHAAMSSTRVMATCALLGEAMGTAVSLCVNDGLTPDGVYEKEIGKLQKKLLDAGCYLPGHVREIPELSKSARLNLSEADRALLFDGTERPDAMGSVHYVTLNTGDSIVFDFGEKRDLHELRLMFDPDFSRMSISVNRKMRVFAQTSSRGKDFEPVHVAATLVRGFEVYADGERVFEEKDNYYALRRIPLNFSAKTVEVKFLSTNGSPDVHVFSCDVC